MPDDQNIGQATDNGEDSQSETEQKTDATASENEGTEDSEGTEDEADETSKGQEAKAPEEAPKDDEEIPVRNRLSTQDYIIGRQKARLARSQAKEPDDEPDDYEQEISPEDEQMITKVVAKKFAPIFDRTIEADDDQEIRKFINDNPDFKQFEATVRRYIKHPSRRALPVKSVFYEVAGDKLLKIGAERDRKANEKSQQTQTGGGSNRDATNAKTNDWELTPAEFEAKQEKIRRGQT